MVHMNERAKSIEADTAWISVSDRLPDRYAHVLACGADETLFLAVYDGPGWDDDYITHWMPLPDPPRE